jgi:1-acyl-sn-glycerol-3-phosphate acyltransferase
MLKILRLSILFPYCAAAFSLGTIFCLLRPFHPNNLYLSTRLLSPIMWLMGIRFSIEGKELLLQQGPAIIISNHQNNWDMFPACATLPTRAVALGKSSIVFIPFFGLFFWLSGNVLIKREKRDNALKSLDRVRSLLTNKNMKIWILPEGTRSRGRGLLPFKKGAFHTAIHTGLPIIPICYSSYAGTINLNRWHAGEIRAQVLPPIATNGMQTSDVNGLTNQCHEMMRQKIAALDQQIHC